MSQHHRISGSQEPRVHLSSYFKFFLLFFSLLCSEHAFIVIKNNKYDLEKVLFLIKDREEKGCYSEKMQFNRNGKNAEKGN